MAIIHTALSLDRVFCGEFGWVGFLVVCFLCKTNPNSRKMFAVGKSGPNATFHLIFRGLGWPWVGDFVGFTIIFTCFPTQQNLVNRQHPNIRIVRYTEMGVFSAVVGNQ